MLRPLSPATYLTLTLCFPLTHTPSVSPFSSPCFPYSCSVAGLCHTFSFFSQWFGIFCFVSAMFLYGLSIAHPSFSHLPFLLPFHSSAYCFLSIFTCLLFSSNLYSYFSHLFFPCHSLSSIPPIQPISLNFSLILPLLFSASSPVFYHLYLLPHPSLPSVFCCLIILLPFSSILP